jgi:NADPH:quinone reductase-like Zn-dependent oxidoreductase
MTVLITGASGGVGIAAMQLAKLRGARVVAIAEASKHQQVLAIGADVALGRDQSPATVLGEGSIDIIVDNVAGAAFAGLLRALKAGGRYVTSGAIAGPMVELDMRTLYLKDLTLIGCTAWAPAVFPNLISYIEADRFRPVIAATWPLERIGDAQRAFLEKRHVGKLVLIPPEPAAGASVP